MDMEIKDLLKLLLSIEVLGLIVTVIAHIIIKFILQQDFQLAMYPIIISIIFGAFLITCAVLPLFLKFMDM